MKNDNPRSSRKRKHNQSDYERKQPRHDHHYESQSSLESRHNHHYHPQERRSSSNSSNQSNYSLIPEPRRSVTEPIWWTAPPDRYGHVTTSTPNYRPSIHDRLDPLPLLNDYNQSSSHRVRSLSFEHSRIPEALFNTPTSPPRWNVEGPSSFPRRPHHQQTTSHHNQATPTRNQPRWETPYESFPPPFRPPTPPRPRHGSRYNTDRDNNRITDSDKTYTKFNKRRTWSFDIELPPKRR